MKTVSIMEAQHNLSKVLQHVSEGHRVAITRRRQKVAEIQPATPKGPLKMPNFAARAKAIWGKGWEGTSSQELLDETRGDR